MRVNKRLLQYHGYLNSQHLRPATVTIYYKQACRLEDYLKGKRPRREMLEAYMEEVEKRCQVSTVNQYVISVNRYLKWREFSDCCVSIRKVQKNWSVENVITMSEYERLLTHARKMRNEKYYLLIRVLGKTGIRISELSGITVESLEEGYAQVYGKNKYRQICLPDELVVELRKYCREHEIRTGCIFRGSKKKEISRSAVWQMLQKIAKQADVPCEKVHPHSFRHLFAKTYLSQYGNLAELADLLGHSGLEITRIYLATSREEKKQKINKLPL